MLFKSIAVFLSFIILSTHRPALMPDSVRGPALANSAAQATQGEARGKAFDLIEEVIIESRSLRLPENRVFIQTAAADLLWPRDEKEARALFAEAFANLDELTDGVGQDGTESIGLAQTASELRGELLLKVARHDAAWARRVRGAFELPSAHAGDENETEESSSTRPMTSLRQPALRSVDNPGEDFASPTEDPADTAMQATPEVRDEFYADVAIKAERAGDLQRAHRMASRITDQFQRQETMAAINRQYLLGAAREGKSEQALGRLQLLRTPEERASVLCELAAALAGRSEKARGLELMIQARNLVANRPRSYAQVRARMKVASAFEAFDPDQSFEMIGTLINQLDELAAATLVADGFVTEEQFTRDDELILKQAIQSLEDDTDDDTRDEGLAMLARSQFERLKAAADKFQHAELRTLAHLRLAEIVLTERTPGQQ
jgi:hypothetical protein